MDRQKEVAAVSSVLFRKYQLCGILGTGRAGTVFLAVHLGLEEYRAVKRVPKSFLEYDRIRREALVLKELRHPGVPIIYDVEEDEFFSYLIEEYLEGESLYDLVSQQGHLSRELTIFYGIQLSGIINYLHLAGPNPILHLDLQPKNLLLCHDTLKLIDFGLAASPDDANIPGERYGTVGCAAPEQYLKDGVLDERTDIYAIGAILHYLYTGGFPELPYEPASSMDADLAAVIDRCIKKEKEERISSAQELGERLEQLKIMGTAAKDRLQSSSLTIALAGSKSGAGTTHVAVGLSVYLRNHGYPNVFVEMNDSGMGAGLGAYAGSKRDQYGLLRYHGFIWRPYYGPGVRLKEPPFKVRILDYGKDMDRALKESADAVVLVCDSSPWSRKEAFEAACRTVKGRVPYGIAYNHTAGGTRIRLPDGADPARCLKVPYYPDPFKESDEIREFYDNLLAETLENKSMRKRIMAGFINRMREWMTGLLLRKIRMIRKG
ncbi:serine/threonine-protein kinase [Lachnospiraceae bacterium 54-53]